MDPTTPPGVATLPAWLPGWLTQWLPAWLPWWVPAALLVPLGLYGLLALLVPFGVFGVKSRLEDIELQIEQLRGEVREMMQLLRPADEFRLPRAQAVRPEPMPGPGLGARDMVFDDMRMRDEARAGLPRTDDREPPRRPAYRAAGRLEPRFAPPPEMRAETRTEARADARVETRSEPRGGPR